ncbi:MAG: hypothetical protein KF752_08765 [Pirellulaceae bacterium]|nr:hypothetical protein [Pirellulaceae bacterium]
MIAISFSASSPVLAQTAIQHDAAAAAIGKLELLQQQRDQLNARSDAVRAIGRLSGWIQVAGEQQPQPNLNAELLVYQQGKKYCLQLLHAADPASGPQAAQRLEVVLFDGETIYTLTSTGEQCRGGVFFEFSQSAVLRSAGFPFTSLLGYWDDALSLKELDRKSLRLIPLGRNGFMLREDRQTYLRQIDFTTSIPYGLQRVALRHPQASAAFREHWLTWDEHAGHPFVGHYVVRHRYALHDPAPDQIIARQHEVELENFESLTELPLDSFSLSSLGIPIGTQFVDYRRNVRGKRLQLVWDGNQFQEQQPTP